MARTIQGSGLHGGLWVVCSVAKKERKRRWRKSARGIAYNRKAAALYRTRYPDRVRAAKARHHKTNSDHILRKVAEWQKANPDKTRTYKANNKAARKGAVGRHSPREIQELFLRQRGLCAICVIDISGKVSPRPHRSAVQGRQQLHFQHPTTLPSVQSSQARQEQ